MRPLIEWLTLDTRALAHYLVVMLDIRCDLEKSTPSIGPSNGPILSQALADFGTVFFYQECYFFSTTQGYLPCSRKTRKRRGCVKRWKTTFGSGVL